MKQNYTEEDITFIKNHITDKLNVIDQTVNWATESLKSETRNEVLLKLKTAKSILHKVQNNIDLKPVIAVFGASQVGKSYLIKNLLSITGEPFYISSGSEKYDFLKEINPPGTGAESTGVVTRFTVDNNIKFADFPVKIKLLTVKDILTIILDAFFLDLKKITTFISRNDLESHLKDLELTATQPKQSVLDESDVLEIKNYFEHHLSKHTILFEGLKESRFFERIGRIIENFDSSDWTKVFNVLWNKDANLTVLFEDLISQLQHLGFEKEGFLKFTDTLRGHGEILDVKNLANLRKEDIESTILKKNDGSTVSIKIPYLSALIAELIFTIPEELQNSKNFLKNSDLLDFPGARTRLGIEADSISKYIPGMLLRGKVSYLFNKYSDDYSINNLLFCSNDKQLEINELSYLLNNWISSNIGADIDERSRSLGSNTIPPLFVVFTFFNNQLRFDTTNDYEFLNQPDKVDYKWETRFIRFFENEIVTSARNWHTEWSHTSPAFKNFYMLRDFKYSDDTFEGFEISGRESEVRSERKSFLQALKNSFVSFPFVRKHFDNPEEAWESSASPNQDGTALIIRSLSQVSNNVTKINYYIGLLNKTMQQLGEELQRYIHTDDIAALRRKNMEAATDFQFNFNMAVAQNPQIFNDFIEKLSINAIDIYNLLNKHIVVDVGQQAVERNDAVSVLYTQYPALESATSYEQAIEIIKNEMWLPSVAEAENALQHYGIKKEELFTPKATTLSKSESYINLVLQYWMNQLDNSEHFKALTDKNINLSHIEFVVEHLKNILTKRKIEDKLILILNEVISEIGVNRGTESFLAETFALIINDLAFSFDMNFVTEEEKSEIKNMAQSTRYFDKRNPTDDQTIASLFETTALNANKISLEKYNRWIEFLRISLLINSGFVNYDEKANLRLINLSKQYTELQLN